MRYAFHFLLVLLTLTLPLRSVAALAACGEAAGHHERFAAHPQAGAHQTDPASHSPQHSDPADRTSALCSGCGACCTGTLSDAYGGGALAGAVPASERIAYSEHPHAGFFPEKPERPPRPSLG
jgi:hypothetical protein